MQFKLAGMESGKLNEMRLGRNAKYNSKVYGCVCVCVCFQMVNMLHRKRKEIATEDRKKEELVCICPLSEERVVFLMKKKRRRRVVRKGDKHCLGLRLCNTLFRVGVGATEWN